MICRVKLTLLSPVSITRRRGTGNDVDTADYVPGTALRGALAATYLESGLAGDSDFRALFLEGNVRFGDLRIEGADTWPLSARVCREHGTDHPVVDRLLATAAGLESSLECGAGGPSLCGAKLEPRAGYVRWEQPRYEAARYVDKQPVIRRTAHSAIHPFLLKAREGQLFSLKSLEAGQILRGVLIAEDEGHGALNRLLNRSGGRFRVGRGKTRGHGLVELVLEEAPGSLELARQNDVRKKIDLTQRRAADMGAQLGGKAVVLITLLSPAIVWNEFLMTSEWLAPGDIGLPREWQLLSWFSQSTPVNGWNAAAGVPKTESIALARGSCFAYGRPLPIDRDELAKWGATLEHNGIGERREEGFGEVSVCLELHARQAEML